MPEKTEYALLEQIGNPNLFVGRKREFKYFLGDWYRMMEKNFTPNQAIISRRKKGKTAFLQRLFNILWSVGIEKKEDKVTVIPFYYTIRDEKITLGDFALDFFTEFIKCYVSYKQCDKSLLSSNIKFKQLKEIINDNSVKKLYSTMASYVEDDNWSVMWEIASRAPSTIARMTGEKIVQIIDEFQNINKYIYDKDKEKLDRMSGTYMQVAEFREAPLIVSGSEVHWLLKIVRSLTGRFQTYPLENLPQEEAEEAIERYAEFTETIFNREAKEKIWELTRGDPLYIKALFLSRYNESKDYTVDENIINVYEKEISEGEIYTTWMEYMLNTFETVNKINSKRIMLYLFNQGKERTRGEIIKDLKLPYTDLEAEEKLNALIAGDLISQGESAYDYTITKDKTYELVFRRVYQKEIEQFVPDIKAEIRKMIGKDNYTKGKFAEFLLKERLKKPFNLKEITTNGEDRKIIPVEIEERKVIQTGVGKNEIDLYIKASDGYELYIDVKNTKNRYGKRYADRWLKIADYIRKNKKDTLFLVYSENGYTRGTKECLIENGIYILMAC
jgi:hypothetical protein